VTAFFAFLYAGLALLLMHQARAQVGERLLGLGIEMLRYEGGRQEAPRTLELNGQPIRLATGHAPHGVTEVLDYYEQKCLERDGRFAEQIAELTDGDPAIVEPESRLMDATLREEDGTRGFVACLDSGSGEEMTPEDVVARLERFRQTLDLSEFGEMRYVVAEEKSDGTTFFVAFWVEGSFAIGEMFPEHGDAPGRDVRDVPRPEGSRRILSTWEEGHRESVTTYVGGSRKADRLTGWYRARMADAGWSLLEVDEATRERLVARGHRPPPESFLSFERGERFVSISLHDTEDGRTTATVLEHR
jgi:hypothetical protein